MPFRRERLQQLMEDPLWKDKPFWLLNLFKFKRGPGGDVSVSRRHFMQYLEAAQAYCGGHGQDWFKGARLVSLDAVSLFPNHGTWDAVVMFEYASPQQFMEAVVNNPGYHAAAVSRIAAEETTAQIVVKPTTLVNRPTLRAEDGEASLTYSTKYWQAAQHLKAPQTGTEDQTIWPDEEAFKTAFQRETFQKPVWAFNLLRYRRSTKDGPLDGRTEYHKYAEAVQGVIQRHMRQPSGIVCGVSPCLTLNDGFEWDEVAIMQYPDIKGFAALAGSPGFAGDAKAHREVGLLTQGLVMLDPHIVNGVVSPGAQISRLKGLTTPSPTIQSKL